MAHTPFSQKEQRDSVCNRARVSSTSCGWAKRPGQVHSTGKQPQLSGSQQFRQKNKATKPSCLPITSHTLPPIDLSVGLWRTLTESLKTSTTKLHLSLSKGCNLWWILGGDKGQTLVEDWCHHNWEGKTTKKPVGYTSLLPPQHIAATLTREGVGDCTGISQLKKKQNLSFSTTYWKRMERPLCIHLLENC